MEIPLATGEPARGLDDIPVSPVSDRILHVVVENKFIYRID
jgi:hypothetical protein